MAACPVVCFNASPLSVEVNVNNATSPFVIGAAVGPGWAPQAPARGGAAWSDTVPAPNVLAPGMNYVSITPQGAVQPIVFAVTLPKSLNWTSVQIYFFFNSYDDFGWLVLNEGQYVTSNVSSYRSGAPGIAPL